MLTRDERELFLKQGYLVVEDVVSGTHLAQIRDAFEDVWAKEQPGRQAFNPTSEIVRMYQLLKYRPFIELVEHPPILDRHRAIFGRQTQLVAYDILRQAPGSQMPERAWHRDFTFPGDWPLAINTIVFIDDVMMDTGPTCVVPGSHLGEALPPKERLDQPLEGEVAVPVTAGSAIFFNGALWHTGGRNTSKHLRRGIFIYYGYWWLKRYYADYPTPWQALEGASPERLELLGLKMPERSLHNYAPVTPPAE
jgi:ectoine hydroxylase-related dioxygenase (phytanoyl-CoA dioxygenase family)